MKYIQLTKGASAIVDDEDFERLNQWKWHLSPKGYAIRRPGVKNRYRKTIYMHRLINNTPDNLQTDHKDRNRLNNQKSNLRCATNQLNSFNKNNRKDNKSGYTGVHFDKERKKWLAFIILNRKFINLGRFSVLNDAVLARKMGENKHIPKLLLTPYKDHAYTVGI